MDCIFNKAIPHSTNKKLIIRPTSKTFITGISSSYDMTYFPELKGYITETEYSSVMTRLNEELYSLWPCFGCFSFGYCCCLCTLGLSFLAPNHCVSEAKKHFLSAIQHSNENVLNRHSLHMSYHSKCSTSWLELEIQDSNNNNSNHPETGPQDQVVHIANNQIK